LGRRLLRLAGFTSGALAGSLVYRRLLGAGRERLDVGEAKLQCGGGAGLKIQGIKRGHLCSR